jgi:hypothetical protein
MKTTLWENKEVALDREEKISLSQRVNKNNPSVSSEGQKIDVKIKEWWRFVQGTVGKNKTSHWNT